MTRLTALERNLLWAHRQPLWTVFALTGAVNILMLTGAIYMLQVYDRVLLSRSGATLVFLSLIMVALYVALYYFDVTRQKLLSLVGRRIEEDLSQPLFRVSLLAPLRRPDTGKAAGTMRDLEEVGRFMSGPGLTAILDLPWMPLYVLVCFLFHPLIGAFTVMAMIVSIALTVVGEMLAKAPSAQTYRAGQSRQNLSEECQRNAEAIAAMGFADHVLERFRHVSVSYYQMSTRLARVLIDVGGITRTFRLVVQSALLGIAAWLVINDAATPGVMIASSIIASRALAPIDQLVGRWRQIVQAHDSWGRVKQVLEMIPEQPAAIELPVPTRELAVEGLWVAPPGDRVATVQNVTFRLQAGDVMGIIGPSGSGKSTLVRALTGVWTPLGGEVRLDGALIDQFAAGQRATAVGYLPQDVQLLRGTVAENICRFSPDTLPPSIISAAKMVGAHEMILALSGGYATDVGHDGLMVSGGQRQRIGLARAVFGEPFVVVLDEPNANLDAEGERALAQAIRSIRLRGGITIIVAHRMNTLQDVNKLLLLVDGQMKAFGDRDSVLAAINQNRKPDEPKGKIAASGGAKLAKQSS